MRLITATSAATLLLSASAAQAQLRTFCLEGSQFSCVGVQLSTSAIAEGTRVTARLVNLQGATIPGVAAQVPWSRFTSVELLARLNGFGGGPVIDADPQITRVGSASQAGSMTNRWFSYNIGESGGDYRGYALETLAGPTAAEIVGCSLPPMQARPYFQTCAATGTPAVEFSFRTEGTWQASDVAIALTTQDRFGKDMRCIVPGTLYDDPEAYHCLEIGGAPPPPATVTAEISPNTISLSASSTIAVYVYSTPTFDATAINPATTFLRIGGQSGTGAPVATRAGAYMTSVRDMNGDGRPDRLLNFLVSAARVQGLSVANPQMRIEDLTGTLRFVATDATPPTITP